MVDNLPIRLLVVDDHPVVREGLRSMLSTCTFLHIQGVCSSGHEAMEALRSFPVDVMLVDMRMVPMSGIQLLEVAKADLPELKVIVFSSYELEEDIFNAVKKGACGYVSKYATEDELLSTIMRVSSGEMIFSKQVLEKFEERTSRREISPRELEILQMLSKGLTNREIASALEVSEFTVKNQIHSLCVKLEVTSRTEAVRIAFDRGLVLVE